MHRPGAQVTTLSHPDAPESDFFREEASNDRNRRTAATILTPGGRGSLPACSRPRTDVSAWGPESSQRSQRKEPNSEPRPCKPSAGRHSAALPLRAGLSLGAARGFGSADVVRCFFVERCLKQRCKFTCVEDHYCRVFFFRRSRSPSAQAWKLKHFPDSWNGTTTSATAIPMDSEG